MDLEYYAYNNLGDYMIGDDFDPIFWERVASTLNSHLDVFSQTNKKSDYSKFAKSMYIDKTEKYYKDLLVHSKFDAISKLPELSINGNLYLNFERIWENVKQLIDRELIGLNRMSIVHGDFCFSNILCGVNEKTNTCILKFVDPRGHFGEDGIFGDPIYDYAKLSHSYSGGYEYIIYDEFDIEESSDLSRYNVTFSNTNKDEISTIFSDFDTLQSKLVEGLIFIGMCSRHYDSVQRQTVMYLTGIKILNEVLGR
jgi:hypothetical protein